MKKGATYKRYYKHIGRVDNPYFDGGQLPALEKLIRFFAV